MIKKGYNFSIFGGVLLIFLFSFNSIRGQEFRGAISGVINDPNGAAVPAATVTVQNIETNISATAVTSEDGTFTFPLLLPGKYKLSATAANFKTSVREGIQLNVADRLTIDFQLEIGATTEVNVAANTDVIEQGSVTTGTLVTQRQVEELPLAEGAPYTLATQAPGINYTGDPNFQGPTANGNLAGFRTNGAAGNQINLDGSPNWLTAGKSLSRRRRMPFRNLKFKPTVLTRRTVLPPVRPSTSL